MSSRAFASAKFEWLERVTRDLDLLAIDTRVASAVMTHLNEKDQDGRAFPSYKTIGDEIGASEHTVIRAVRRLHDRGHLIVTWGQQGRGHPNQYWMGTAGKPASVQVKKPARAQVSEKIKPASSANKTCTRAGESEGNPIGERAPLTGGGSLSKEGKESSGGRETPPEAGARSAGGALPGGRPPAAGRQVGEGEGAPLDGEILSPESADNEAVYQDLRAIWQRGHLKDNKPAEQHLARTALDKALERGSRDDVIAGAKRWRDAFAAGDGVRYLQGLADWLDVNGWTEPPPKPKAHKPNANTSGGQQRYPKKQRWGGGGRKKETLAQAMLDATLKKMQGHDDE